jgi:hypothetical protein
LLQDEYCDLCELPKVWCTHAKQAPKNWRTEPDLSEYSAKLIDINRGRSSRPKARIAAMTTKCPACQKMINNGDPVLPASDGLMIHLDCGDM